jgi:hypothetical protein
LKSGKAELLAETFFCHPRILPRHFISFVTISQDINHTFSSRFKGVLMAKDATVRYADRKEAIKAVLKDRARQRKTIRYGELGKAVGIPAQGPWKPILDEISREEKPDITYLVVNKDGLSSQIGYSPANPPSDKQRRDADRVIAAVFAHYAN